MLLLLALTGCFRYSCGVYTVQTTLYGTVQGGEWCGLNGSYAFQDPETDEVQLILSPNAKDFDTDAALNDVVAVVDLRFPGARLVPGETLDTSDDLFGLCGSAPGGAGSGTLQFEDVQGSVTIGEEHGRTLIGDVAYRMTWDVSCPSTTASGEDPVEIAFEEVFDQRGR